MQVWRRQNIFLREHCKNYEKLKLGIMALLFGWMMIYRCTFFPILNTNKHKYRCNYIFQFLTFVAQNLNIIPQMANFELI